MKNKLYLLDTHALIFWNIKAEISIDFIAFLDEQDRQESLLISSISFWEIALLIKKGKLALSDLHTWKDQLLSNTHIRLIDPTASEMIDSTLLPDHHKDPFDRLLIAQANHHNALLVTRDPVIQRYPVSVFWM